MAPDYPPTNSIHWNTATNSTGWQHLQNMYPEYAPKPKKPLTPFDKLDLEIEAVRASAR